MPARWKYTLIFEGRGHGWSETFYVENDTDDFPTVYAALANIAPKRAPLLGAECRIKGDRLAEVISTTGVVQKRVSQVRRLNFAGTQAHSADQTNTSLLATWITGDQKSKRLAFMGGVWDDVLPAPDVFSPSGAWTTFWNQWVAACQTAKLGWLTSGRTTPATITGYTFDATTGLTTYVLKAPGLVWPNGDDRPNKVAVEFPLAARRRANRGAGRCHPCDDGEAASRAAVHHLGDHGLVRPDVQDHRRRQRAAASRHHYRPDRSVA
jgi:hypothetical protein